MFRTNGGRIGSQVITSNLEGPGVWSLAEQATLKRANAWPGSADLYFANVQLLLQMDGTNNSTTFTDTSSFNRTVTRNGTARISTTQSKFGGSSCYFPSDGSNLTLATSSAWNLSGKQFTVELFFYKEVDERAGIFDCGQAWRIITNDNGTLNYSTSGISRITSSTSNTPAINQWHHLALCRFGTTTTLYVNGQSLGSTSSDTSSPGSALLYIGTLSNEQAAATFKGYIDSFRITLAARYTGNFTPPALSFPNG